MKILLLLTFIQLDTLPPQELLFASIDSFYALQAQVELLEFHESKKGEWLKYLPSIGIVYTLEGKPRPSIGYSTNIIYGAKKDRQRRKVKRLSILEKSRIEAEKQKAKVTQLLLEYESFIKDLESKKQILSINTQLFEIEKTRYENLEIAPSDFLKAKRQFLSQLETFNNWQTTISSKRKEILVQSFQN